MKKSTTYVNEFLKKFTELTQDPTAYLSAQSEKENDVKLLLKKSYDFMKNSEDVSTKNKFTLSNLIIDHFDSEQIWQQIELQNQFISEDLENRLTEFIKNNYILSDDENDVETTVEESKLEKLDNDESSLESDNDEQDFDDSSDMDSLKDDEDDEDEENDNLDVGSDNLDENSDDLDEDSDESIDYFQDIPLDDEEEVSQNGETNNFGPMYKDFFKDPDEEAQNPSKKRVRFDLNDDFEDEEEEKDMENSKRVRFNLNDDFEDDNEEQEDENTTKSTFEERQERLRQKVEKLETEALSEKPWQMIGETDAKKRPKNSLLEHNLEFDLTARPAPIITETVALKLEEIIIQRIKDKSWDDVERKIKPVDTPFEFKMKLTLNQSKSKSSLAEIYEKEYLKQREAADPENKFKEEEEPKEHQRIKQLMDTLFQKLDALSNYHYTPKPAAPELKIITNLPAVTMEEAIPVTVSDATLLAPEEIQAKKKGNLIGKEERTSTDKKRDRRHKKLKQRQKRKETEKREKLINKLKPGMGNKYSKEKIRKEFERLSKDSSVSQFKEDVDGKKSSKSSKQFFERLQDTVENDGKTNNRKKNTIKR